MDPTPRIRQRNGQTVLADVMYEALTGPKGGTQNYNSAGPYPTTVISSKEKMEDVVVPSFKKRQSAGEIFNNPMRVEKITLNAPLMQYSVFKEHPNNGSPSTSHAFGMAQFGHDYVFTLDDDADSLSRKAITRAYGNVSANEGNSALWIGELKETVSGLFKLGKSIEKLVRATKDERKKWAKGQLSVKEMQSLTLAILYGVVPLEQQINDFMEGLFQQKPSDSRATARGFEVMSTNKFVYKSIGTFNDCRVILKGTESVQVQARAGVLFDVDTSDLPFLAVIFDPKQVVSTAYALARLSFVLEWFINIGGTLRAWSPSFGTKILSAWLALEVNREFKGEVFLEPIDPTSSGWKVLSAVGTSTIVKTEYVKQRSPIDRSDLAILPRVDIDLNLDKIFALILLFAKNK